MSSKIKHMHITNSEVWGQAFSLLSVLLTWWLTMWLFDYCILCVCLSLWEQFILSNLLVILNIARGVAGKSWNRSCQQPHRPPRQYCSTHAWQLCDVISYWSNRTRCYHVSQSDWWGRHHTSLTSPSETWNEGCKSVSLGGFFFPLLEMSCPSMNIACNPMV